MQSEEELMSFNSKVFSCQGEGHERKWGKVTLVGTTRFLHVLESTPPPVGVRTLQVRLLF